MSIRIRRLRLLGTSRPYDVSFLDVDRVLPMSIIAGEISTGKSTILEFVDYCLGGGTHPRHQEIQRKVHGALLEIDLDGERRVIERRVFSDEHQIFVHHCSLDEIGASHSKSRRVLEAGSPNSLSTMLLGGCGLAGLSLREAPTQQSSRSDPLSFRDIMWLCFLPNERLGSKSLLHESNHMRQLKLRQVIDVVFGIHDDQVAQLSAMLDEAQRNRAALLAEIRSLQDFLEEQEVPDQLALGAERVELQQQRLAAETQLADLTLRMRAATDYADILRAQFAVETASARRAATVVRDRETLLRRLEPLQSQYGEDESKLVFFAEARRLFDPLRVRVCPACMQDLPSAAAIVDSSCSLCGQAIAAEDDVLDVGRELTAVRARRREIEKYIGEVKAQLAGAERLLTGARERESASQRDVDERVISDLAPYIAERDELIRRQESVSRAIGNVDRFLGYHLGLDRRRGERGTLEARISKLNGQIREIREQQPSRDSILNSLTTRFRAILEAYGFPKLNDPEPPFIDRYFTPHVRGNEYRYIGSTGALTLIALAWTLALFEVATESGFAHPGFLMIDSPSKNLTPRDNATRDEFTDPQIVSRVWDHMLSWSAGNSSAQLIVVENAPPASEAESVVVRYTGRAGIGVYGLIDDEVPPE